MAGIGAAGVAALPGAGWSGISRTIEAGLGGAAIVTGMLLAIRGVLDLGGSLSPFPRPSSANRLVDSGAYRYVRHPVYAGLVLAGLGWGLLTAAPIAIALTLILFGWFDLKARREEAWLVARHADYAAYRTRTRKFVPFVY
jgi:protein-S-isoprenylcysteine O-methyltransferase Ste14